MKLTHRTLFFTVIPIIVLSVVMTIVNDIILSELLIEHGTEEATLLLQIASYEMVNPMYNLDVDKLNEIIDGIEINNNVLQVLILFPDGRVLTDGSDEAYHFGNILHDGFLNTPDLTEKEQVLISEDLIRVSTPIILNEPIGVVTLDYSLESVNMQILQSTGIAFLIVAILLSVFVVVAVVFSRSITQPIMKISKNIDDISEGKYTSTKEEFSIPEIQKLNHTIDEMYRKLDFFQSELSKNERLATIGELSARIAHDLRNPLTSIQNSVELLKVKNPDLVKKNTEYFDYIDSSINKINMEINGVLNHTKVRPIEKSVTKFSKVIEHALSSLEIPENIKITTPDEDEEIFCDAEQFENVLSNLIGNSIDAISKEEGKIIINLDGSEDSHIISVSDDGPGIPEKFVESIFEPLFTTKQYGTGLGLVNCKNIVHGHDGTIEVKNNPTTFTIKIPKK